MAIKLPRDKYPKKRELAYPLLEKIIGRDTDLVKTRSGKYMVVHSFAGIIEHYDEIMQFCVVQKDLDGIEILYIPSESFHEKVLMQIKEQLMSYLQDENFEIKFKKVGSIEPTKSGKPQIIKSLLKKDVLMKFENK